MTDTFHPNYPGQRRVTDPDGAMFARDTKEAVSDALILAAKSAQALRGVADDERDLFETLAEFIEEAAADTCRMYGLEYDSKSIREEAWGRAEHELKMGRAA